MKRVANFFILSVLILGTMVSCSNRKGVTLPPCTGRPGELILVLADDFYKGAIGDSLIRILTQDEPSLPQTGMEGAEPMFDLIHIPPTAFGNMIRPARNLILTEIGPHITKAEIIATKDYWAADQYLMRLHAPDKESFIQLIEENRETIVNTFREGEVDRQAAFNRRYQNVPLATQLSSKHQIDIAFPKGFEARIDTGNFIWVQYDPQDIIQGVLIWSTPYTDESQLEYNRLITSIDQYMKPRVPGPAIGSYMALELDYPISTRAFTLDSVYVRELKGLWETEGAFMGGPFVSWTLVDEKRDRLVTTFGFVYAPRTNKRNHIRKVESILKTIRFPD